MNVCIEKGSGGMIVNPTLEHGDEGKHHFHLLVTLIHFCCFDKHLILLFINK